MSHILIVEDSPQVRRLTVRLLGRLGFEVSAAEDAETALAMVEEGLEVDLFLVDVVMPGMSGFELAFHLRTLSAAPILHMSGFDAESLEAYGPEPEDLDLLPKPFGSKELAARIASALERGSVAPRAFTSSHP